MNQLRRTIALLALSFQFLSGSSQDFPPPQFVQIEIIGSNIAHIFWEGPPRELSSYNIYYNDGLIANTAATEYYDTIFFIYWNTYCITAVYTNPDGESDPDDCCETVCIPVALFFPYYEDFEGLTSLLACYAMTGNDFWEKCTEDYYAGEQSILFTSNIAGNSARILTPIFSFSNNVTVDLKISLWYHHLYDQNEHDDLFFIYQSDTGFTRTAPLPVSESWAVYDTIMSFKPSGKQFGFDAECKNGSGVWVDDFSMEIIGVGVEDHFKNELALGQIFPNPCSAKTSISFYVPSDGFYNISIYDLRGVKLKILIDDILTRGHHKITFDVSNIGNGIYLIRLEGEQAGQSKIMIINR